MAGLENRYRKTGPSARGTGPPEESWSRTEDTGRDVRPRLSLGDDAVMLPGKGPVP